MGNYEQEQEARAAALVVADLAPSTRSGAESAARAIAVAAIDNVEQHVGVASYGVTSDVWAENLARQFLGRLSPESRAKYRSIIAATLEAQRRHHVVSTAGAQSAAVAADPVEHYRGEFVHEATDLVVPGAGLDFAFQRTYRSQSAGAGPLGHRWDFGYHMRLFVDDVRAALHTGAGRQEDYVRHARWPDAGFAYYVPPDGSDATLEPLGVTAAPVGWVRRAPDGLRHVFTPEPGSSGWFLLTRIEDRWGNYLDFTYATPPSGIAHVVRCEVNHPARWVTLVYDEHERIVRVSDHTERTWRYRYDAHGDLVGVTTPATPEEPRGATTEFRYTSRDHGGELGHLLTDIFDAHGRHYLHTEYGVAPGQADYRRVVRQRVGTGDYWFRYEPVIDLDLSLAPEDRPTMRCWLKERSGSISLFVYNGWGSLLWKQMADDGPGHAPRRVVWQFRYNRDGQLTASRSPEGRVTQVLTGRDHFLRVHGLASTDDLTSQLWLHPGLTAEVRRGFGRGLATVERATPRGAPVASWSERWGDVYAIEPGDLVVKHTYEPEFGQPLTVSDPRATTASDPRAVEPPAYAQHLTRYAYAADATRGLVRVIAPTPTWPDSTSGGPVVTEILARDGRGRVTRARDAVGTVTETTYEPDASGPSAGFARAVVVDPGGLALTTRYDRDELGRVLRTYLPRAVDGPPGHFVIEQAYDALDRVTWSRRATPIATETRFRYEAAGEPTESQTDWVDGDGATRGVICRRWRYDEEHRVVRESLGSLEAGDHRRTSHGYNAAGLRTVTVAPNDTNVQWRYDAQDQLAHVIHGAGVGESIETFVRDRDGRVIEHRSAEGRVTTTRYDGLGRAVAVTDAAGHVTRTSYDAGGRPTVVRRFERTADGRYRLLARSATRYDELGRAVRTEASLFDEPPAAVEADAVATAYEDATVGTAVEQLVFYDAAGRVVLAVDALGHAVQTTYDAVGRATRVVDPTGNRIETHYDAHGNPVRVDRFDQVRNLAGAVIGVQVLTSSAAYDALDRRVQETDGLGNVTTRVYDSLDREVRVVDPLGNVTERDYDRYGDLIAVREFRTTTGDGTGAHLTPHEVRFEHDRAGQVVARVDALGRTTGYRRDKWNRVVEEVFPDGARLAMQYDRDSLVTAVRDAHGVVVRTQYDVLARPVRTITDVAEVDAGLAIEGQRELVREYDGLGRLTRTANEVAILAARYDSLGRPIEEATTVLGGRPSWTVRRAFDAAGRRTALEYPGGRTLSFTHDEAGRLRSITHVSDGVGYPGVPGQARTIARYAYAGSRLCAAGYANGTTAAVTHDARGGAIELHHVGPSGTLLRVQQLRDGARAPRARVEVEGGPGGPRLRGERFGYDARYQLGARSDVTAALWDLAPFGPAAAPEVAPAPARQTLIDAAIGPRLGPDAPAGADAWRYDLVGNRALTRAGGAETAFLIGEDGRDRYAQVGAAPHRHDRAGNLTSDGRFAYVYDGLRRLVRVLDLTTGAPVARYDYDPAGRRVIEDHGGVEVVLAYDGDDRIADLRAGTCVAQYVHGTGVDDPVELAAAGAHHTYHLDFQGSVRVLSDAAGTAAALYRFDPFGLLLASSGPALGTPGQPAAPGGPGASGSSAATQPFGFAARPRDPATGHSDLRARVYLPALGRFLQRDPAGPVDGHLYTYAGNHPLAFGDPSGLARSERADTQQYPVLPAAPADWQPYFSAPVDVMPNDGTILRPGIYIAIATGADRIYTEGAHTRARDIKDTPGYDPDKHLVVELYTPDLGILGEQMEAVRKKHGKKYGYTQELWMFGHSTGVDGPRADMATSGPGAIGKQMDVEGWERVDFNWDPAGHSRAIFLGCRALRWAEDKFLRAQLKVGSVVAYPNWTYPSGSTAARIPAGRYRRVYHVGTSARSPTSRRILSLEFRLFGFQGIDTMISIDQTGAERRLAFGPDGHLIDAPPPPDPTPDEKTWTGRMQ